MAKSDATKKVTLTVNLEKLFGHEFDDPDVVRQIGEEIIARIVNRTQRGRDKKGKLFSPYSPNYQKPGKSNPPNLTLRGDLLGKMDIIKQTKNTITIGWDQAKQRLKAENHIHGVTLPKRDFLGLPASAFSDITKEFEDE